MSDLLDKAICLKLNALWSPIAVRTVRDAVTDLTSESHGRKPALALDITYPRKEDGMIDYDATPMANPVEWEEWITLPVRPEDLSIQASRGLLVRVPTVIVAANYSRMPMKRFRPNRRTIFERDRGVCQVTGRYVGWEHGNLDHVFIPKSEMKRRGLHETFENLAWMDKKLNTRKGDKPLAAIGLKLIRSPKAPADVPISTTFTEAKHPTWQAFILAKH